MTLMNALRDGEQLVRWAEPNTIALNDPKVDEAVRRAFSNSSPSEVAFGGLMFRPCDLGCPAEPLIDVLVEDRHRYRSRCDRCGSNARPDYRLWIPSGATVAEFACCWFCHDVLNEAFSGLDWR